MNVRKILVIGGAGFLGRHLIESLLIHDIPVRCLDRVKPRWLDTSVEFCEGDFAATHLLDEVLEGCDVVFHLASTTLPKNSNDDPLFDVSSNVQGTIGLLELAVKKGVKKFIFISSGGTVYGIPSELPVKESHPTNPICSYGIVKLTIEKYLRLFRRLYGLETCSLRLSNPYGEYQRVDKGQGAIAVFCDKALHKQTVEIWGDGSIIRDYIYVKDCIGAMIRSLKTDCMGMEFNIGSGVGVNLNQILECLDSILGERVERRYLRTRNFDVPQIFLDNSRAKKILDWEFRTNLVDGITKTLHWLQMERTHE